MYGRNPPKMPFGRPMMRGYEIIDKTDYDDTFVAHDDKEET